MFEVLFDGGLGILVLGLFIGMQHALEADHVAAVSSIAAKQSSVRRIITHGAVWGVGHTLTLMLIAGGALLFGLVITDAVAGWLEFTVGLMLIGLGGNLVYTMIKERIHFHRHRHDDLTHFHAHSHKGETAPHDPNLHDHAHPKGLPVRTLLVGMMHGMAGSAALMVLTATTVGSVPMGFAYIVLFGLGSVVGMAVLSAFIAVPLTWTAKALTWANRSIQGAVGVATVILGWFVIEENLMMLLGF